MATLMKAFMRIRMMTPMKAFTHNGWQWLLLYSLLCIIRMMTSMKAPTQNSNGDLNEGVHGNHDDDSNGGSHT